MLVFKCVDSVTYQTLLPSPMCTVQVSTIAQLRNDALEMQERQRVTEANNAELENEVQQLRDNILAKKQEADREQRRKERLEREITDVKQVNIKRV